MIHLITGLPGAGKTLFTIWYFKRISETENRPIYFHGIKDLALPWIPLEDPQRWFDVEPNAIVIIDECQRIFRPAGPMQGIPEHISRLETHRHEGIDLVLITQQPMLLHKNVRQLVGDHRHVVRMFGGHRSTIHQWPECQENTKARNSSQKTIWKYPKEVFDYYKSAEVHTHKRSIPPRVWFMLASPLIAGALIWYAWRVLHPDPVTVTETASTNARATTGQNARPDQGGGGLAKLTPAQWLEEQQPRLPDFPHTAPVYDQIARPVHAPYPAACVLIRNGCQCYTQQGTRLATSDQACRQIVERGFFVAWDTSGRAGRTDQTGEADARSVPPASAAAAASDLATGPTIAGIAAPDRMQLAANSQGK